LIEPDANKACNLSLCLTRKGRFDDARQILDGVVNKRYSGLARDESFKTVSQAEELMREMEELRRKKNEVSPLEFVMLNIEEEVMERLDVVMNEWASFRSRRLPIFESPFRDQMAC